MLPEPGKDVSEGAAGQHLLQLLGVCQQLRSQLVLLLPCGCRHVIHLGSRLPLCYRPQLLLNPGSRLCSQHFTAWAQVMVLLPM